MLPWWHFSSLSEPCQHAESWNLEIEQCMLKYFKKKKKSWPFPHIQRQGRVSPSCERPPSARQCCPASGSGASSAPGESSLWPLHFLQERFRDDAAFLSFSPSPSLRSTSDRFLLTFAVFELLNSHQLIGFLRRQTALIWLSFIPPCFYMQHVGSVASCSRVRPDTGNVLFILCFYSILLLTTPSRLVIKLYTQSHWSA